jgi:hypothetical protein
MDATIFCSCFRPMSIPFTNKLLQMETTAQQRLLVHVLDFDTVVFCSLHFHYGSNRVLLHGVTLQDSSGSGTKR